MITYSLKPRKKHTHAWTPSFPSFRPGIIFKSSQSHQSLVCLPSPLGFVSFQFFISFGMHTCIRSLNCFIFLAIYHFLSWIVLILCIRNFSLHSLCKLNLISLCKLSLHELSKLSLRVHPYCNMSLLSLCKLSLHNVSKLT